MIRIVVLALLAIGWNPTFTTSPHSALAQVSAPPMYDLIDLGTLGGEISQGNDIDAAGRVVGHSQTKGDAGCSPPDKSADHAFIWENGLMTDLGTLGGTNSEARAIATDGQIVGWSEVPNGDTHAALWPIDDEVVDLGTLGGANSVATAINARGQVVGVSDLASGETLAFLVEDGQMFAIPQLVWASAIDEDGQIVGEKEDGGSVMIKDGQVKDLAPLMNAVGMDAAGRVYGYIEFGDRGFHAAIWDDGDITDLGGLPDRPDSYPFDVNTSGQVVGVTWLQMICGYPTEAALWSNGTLIVLGDQVAGSSPRLIDARAINDGGQIVATLAGDDPSTGHRMLHAVVLTPREDGNQ